MKVKFALSALAAVLALADNVQAASVQPHEAIYDITVREWRLPGTVTSYTGTQILRLDSTCTAWRITGHFGITAQLQNGRSFQFESDISNSEAKDGSRLTFNHQTRLNGKEVAPIRGVASRSGPGVEGRIRFSLPKDRTVVLPKEARFPVASRIILLPRFIRPLVKSRVSSGTPGSRRKSSEGSK